MMRRVGHGLHASFYGVRWPSRSLKRASEVWLCGSDNNEVVFLAGVQPLWRDCREHLACRDRAGVVDNLTGGGPWAIMVLYGKIDARSNLLPA